MQQNVAATQQAKQQQVDDFVLSDNHLADFLAKSLPGFAKLVPPVPADRHAVRLGNASWYSCCLFFPCVLGFGFVD